MLEGTDALTMLIKRRRLEHVHCETECRMCCFRVMFVMDGWHSVVEVLRKLLLPLTPPGSLDIVVWLTRCKRWKSEIETGL